MRKYVGKLAKHLVALKASVGWILLLVRMVWELERIWPSMGIHTPSESN